LWDLENIPFSRLEEIKKVVKYTPDELFIISKQNLGKKLTRSIQTDHFKILNAHKSISDDKIISIMKLYKDRKNIILISSDTDFTKEVNRYIQENKLHWILIDSNKKGIMMRVNLASPNLTISTLYKVKKKQKQVNSPRGKKNTIKVKFHHLLSKFKKLFIKKKTSTQIAKEEKNLQKQQEQELVVIVPNNPYRGKRSVFMRNPMKITRKHKKGKIERCGTLLFRGKDEKILTLYTNLLKIYEIPEFKKDTRFNEVSEVENLIYFDSFEREYYLNEFEVLKNITTKNSK